MWTVCSTRNRLVLSAALSGCLLLPACQSARQEAPRAELSKSVLPVDPAMQRRDFDPTTVRYASGGVIAGSSGKYWEPAPEPAWATGLTEPFIAIANTLTVPAHLITTPPGKPLIYEGIQTPRTSNAQPATKIIR